MDELLRELMRQDSSGDKCLVISPDGFYGCLIRKGHEGDCRNPSANVSWCGWCSAWMCRKPELHAERSGTGN